MSHERGATVTDFSPNVRRPSRRKWAGLNAEGRLPPRRTRASPPMPPSQKPPGGGGGGGSASGEPQPGRSLDMAAPPADTSTPLMKSRRRMAADHRFD